MISVILFFIFPAESNADVMMLWRDDWLQQVRSAMESNPGATHPALDAIITEADLALSRGPYSVTDKTGFPKDRDIHDYYSQAPYWWPDPEKADGLPYIRRDGDVNPDKYSDAFDSKRKSEMVQDVVALTLAGYFTSDSRDPCYTSSHPRK